MKRRAYSPPLVVALCGCLIVALPQCTLVTNRDEYRFSDGGTSPRSGSTEGDGAGRDAGGADAGGADAGGADAGGSADASGADAGGADAGGHCDSDDCYDCAGVLHGPATVDMCGVCDADPDNDCVQDCEGAWGGEATEDMCGVCDTNRDNDCVQDCEGTWGGTATEDMCDVCDTDPDNDCVQDCEGTWGGTATEDNCGTCDTNPNNDCPGIITVFSARSNGNMEGRRGADSLCAAAMRPHDDLAGRTARALVCIEEAREITRFPSLFGVPSDVGIHSLTGTRLATSWPAFMSGLEASLSVAGVLGGTSRLTQFFSGCGNRSSGCIHNCRGFTTEAPSVSACVGHSNYTDDRWIAWGNILSCDRELDVLCIAYASP
jgi:hypothetical protein